MRKELRVLLVSVCFVALFTSNYSHGYAVNISEYNFADETDMNSNIINGTNIDNDNVSIKNSVIINDVGNATETVELYDSVVTGKCGDNLTWTLYAATWELYITGTGPMDDYRYTSDIPWYYLRDYVYDVHLDEGITSIGTGAFYMCTALTHINFPESLETINSDAFICCNLLNIEIPDNVIKIGAMSFYQNEHLKSVKFSNNLSEIPRAAFGYCARLDNVVIPDSVTTINQAAFYGCESLSSVILSRNLEYIGFMAFGFCTDLSKMNLPQTLHIIERYAFENCINLISIEIPNSVSEIGRNAFIECTSLETVILPDKIEAIQEQTFASCSSLTSIYIPADIKIIKSCAFAYCSSLSDIAIPESVNDIEWGAFYACSNLHNISLPKKITKINAYLFEYCSALDSIEIPEKVKTINEEAFAGCTGLTSIYLSNEITQIETQAFYNCINLTDVYFAKSYNEWETVFVSSGNEWLSNANLYSEYQNDSAVEIDAVNVMGGIEIILTSDKDYDIYYTTNGDQPCTDSLLYEKPITLSIEGTYKIKAAAYSNHGMGKSVVYDVVLDKSDSPEIWYEDGYININGTADVFYTTDFSSPSIFDNRYNEPISINERSGIAARCFELGKAGSDVVRYVIDIPKNEPYSVAKDSYQFGNNYKSFGYGSGLVRKYTIPRERYYDYFGVTKGEELFQTNSGVWGGSCYGLSATSAMFYKNYLALSDYYDTDCLFDITAPQSPDMQLTRLIEQFQIAQFGDNAIKNGSVEEIKKKVENFEHTGTNPILIILYGEAIHAVMPYRVETISENEFRIYIYDSDNPYDMDYDKERYIEVKNGIVEYGRYTTMRYSSIDELLLEENEARLFETSELTNENTFFLSLNSDMVSILNSKGVEMTKQADIISYPTYDISGNINGTIWSLPVDEYTITNKDAMIDTLNVSIADSKDYYKVVSQDISAKIEVGISDIVDRLYIETVAQNNNQVEIIALNNEKRLNDIIINSDYIKVGSCNNKSIIINSNANIMNANGEYVDLKAIAADFYGKYENGINMMTVSKKFSNTINHNCDLIILEKPSFIKNKISGSLTLRVENKGEASELGTLWIAVYDYESGKLIGIKSYNIDSVSVDEKKFIQMEVDFGPLKNGEYDLKVFVWNKTLAPLSRAGNLYYSNIS